MAQEGINATDVTLPRRTRWLVIGCAIFAALLVLGVVVIYFLFGWHVQQSDAQWCTFLADITRRKDISPALYTEFSQAKVQFGCVSKLGDLMARLVFFDGPSPPEGRAWCAICVMLVKQSVIEAEHTMIDMSKRGDESDPPMRIDAGRHVKLGGHELAVAVTRAISTVVPQWGPMDVCWSHALGLQLLPGGVAPASPQEAAMVNQAVQLDQRQRRQG